MTLSTMAIGYQIARLKVMTRSFRGYLTILTSRYPCL
jgi:hypothetical protein